MLLFPIFPWLLCIVLFSPCSTALDGKEVVDAVVNALKSASTGPDDVWPALNLFGSQAALLMKAAVPIGAIVSKTPNLKPQSEEYKALIDLQNRTEKIWKDIQNRIVSSYKVIGDEITNLRYAEKVNLPIEIMKELTDEYLDPSQSKSHSFIDGYKRECKFGERAPQSILGYLHFRLVEKCQFSITPTEAQKLAEQREYLLLILLRLQVGNEPLPDLGLYLKEFSTLYKQLGKAVLNEDLDVFKNSFSSYETAIQAFFKELRDRASIQKVVDEEPDCPLRALVTTSNFNYPYIKEFVSQLKNELIEVAFIAAVCANVTHNGDAASIDKYTKKIADDVTVISSHISTLLNDSLASAWPSAHNGILGEQILRTVPKSGYVDEKSLKIVADVTHPLLINTGIPNHAYEMLIVRAADKGYEFFFDGLGNYCSLKNGTFGFHTIIGRIPLNSANPQQQSDVAKGMLHRSKYAQKLNITIQSEMDELYNAANLPMIADSLTKKIGKEFITQRDFHCWAIVRQWAYRPCPTIKYLSSAYNSANLSSISTLSYGNKGRFYEDCEEFRFFFSLCS